MGNPRKKTRCFIFLSYFSQKNCQQSHMESDPKLIFEFFHNSWVKPAFSRPRLQPLWKLQPPKGPGELQWTQWTHAQTHFRPAKPKEAGKKICCKMQSCRVSTHHITKLSNIGSRLQKYPRVFKSVRVCQSQCPRAHLQSLLQTGFGIGARAIPEQSRSVGDHFDHFDAKLGSFAW